VEQRIRGDRRAGASVGGSRHGVHHQTAVVVHSNLHSRLLARGDELIQQGLNAVLRRGWATVHGQSLLRESSAAAKGVRRSKWQDGRPAGAKQGLGFIAGAAVAVLRECADGAAAVSPACSPPCAAWRAVPLKWAVRPVGSVGPLGRVPAARSWRAGWRWWLCPLAAGLNVATEIQLTLPRRTARQVLMTDCVTETP
jgi:hypothetical protein